MAKKINLPSEVSPEKFELMKKPLVKAIIGEFYLDNISDVTVEEGTGNTIVQGKFLDRQKDESGRANNKIFEYSISESGGEFIVNYQPIAGNFNESDDWVDDEQLMLFHARTRKPVTLSFAEGEELTETWFEEYQQRVTDQLAEELTELGFAEFVQDEETDWVNTPKAEWAV